MPTFYHRTPFGDAILREGFRDASGNYGFHDFKLTGVWISDIPLGEQEGARGDTLFEITLPDDFDVSFYELVGEPNGLREWCVPASVLNAHGALRIVPSDEEARFVDPRFPEPPTWE